MVFDSSGNQLDLGVCNETKVTITSPINLDSKEIDFNFAKEMQSEGIDIFNASEPLFTDKCIPYSKNGKD